MISILIGAAPAHFLAGLALFTLAAMIHAALSRAAGRTPAAWGLAVIIALGLAEWCLLAVGGSTRPMAWQLAHLALQTAALAGLIELGRICTTGPRTGLLPRWSHPLVAALMLAALLFGWLNPLEFALRLAVLWQAGWLAAGYFTRGQATVGGNAGETTIPVIDPSTLSSWAILGGLLVYLVAACVAIPLLGMVAALVAVAAAYLAFGPRGARSRQAELVWRFGWPVGFVLIAAGGCFALWAASETETDVLLVERVEPADGAAADDLASADLSSPEASDNPGDDMASDGDRAAGREQAAAARLVRQAKRYGLGVAPIIVFVLLIWGLSRLPFVH